MSINGIGATQIIQKVVKLMTDYNELKNLIETGYDIEFSYKEKSYSITETSKGKISFCEYYKEPKYFDTVDEFMINAKIDNTPLSNIWGSVTDLMY